MATSLARFSANLDSVIIETRRYSYALESEKDNHLWHAVSQACSSLRENIDYDELEDDIVTIFTAADDEQNNWRERIIGDLNNFYHFLETFEKSVFMEAKLGIEARIRLRDLMIATRYLLGSDDLPSGAIPRFSAREVVSQVRSLEQSICNSADTLHKRRKDQLNRTDRQRSFRSLARYALAGVTILNTVGAVKVGHNPVIGYAASVTIGNLGISLLPN